MFYWLAKWTIGVTLRLVFRPTVVGLENVPAHGGAIIASNHLSFSDSFFAPLMIPGRKVTFMAKAEYFTRGGVKGWFSRVFFKGIGQLSVDRSGGKASAAGLRTGLEVLQAGELLGIYPEGTRSPDGRLYRGRTGIARLVLEAGVPVIPCAMVGTDRLQPPGEVVPHIVRPQVRFGKPLDFSRYRGMETDRLVLRAITDEIMYELMRLSGQQYVDIYATKAKDLLRQQSREHGRRGRVARPAEEPPAVAEPAGEPAGEKRPAPPSDRAVAEPELERGPTPEPESGSGSGSGSGSESAREPRPPSPSDDEPPPASAQSA